VVVGQTVYGGGGKGHIARAGCWWGRLKEQGRRGRECNAQFGIKRFDSWDGTGGSNNRVVRTLHPGSVEMTDNGDNAEDDTAATEEAREMGINGESREKDGRNFARGSFVKRME